MLDKFIRIAASCLATTLLTVYTAMILAAPLEEVEVTAQRVPSKLSETPAAVTAVTADKLLDASITEMSQLGEIIPNVKIENTDSTKVTIRSISSNDATEKGDPSASVMFDGIYIARPQAQNAFFFDIDRVEVLLGPQGTLWGRNSTAGVVNVITKVPVHEFEGAVNISIGNYGARQANGVVNVPVTANVALRAALYSSRRDSFIIDAVEQQFDDNPAQDDIAGRVSALWDINQDVSLLVRADFANLGGNFGRETAVPFSRNFTAVAPGELARQIGDKSGDMRTRDWVLQTSPDRDNDIWGVAAELNWRLPAFDLTYVSSYRQFDQNENFAIFGTRGRRTGHYEQLSHELRIVRTTDALTAQAGLYYFEEESAILLGLNDHPEFFPDFGPSVFAFPQDPTIAENKAAYVQVSHALTSQLNLTVGVRYSDDHKERTGATTLVPTLEELSPDAASAFGGFWLSNDASRDWAETTWRLGLDYHFDEETMVFGNVATGYKAGGFNDGCEAGSVDRNGILCNQARPADDLYYSPELLDAYELGVKSDFFDNHARLSVTAFYYDFKNMQLSGVDVVNNAPQLIIKNAGTAKVKGLEAEMQFAISDYRRLDLALTLQNGKFREYAAPVNETETIDFSGKDLDRSPDVTLALSYTYTQGFPSGAYIDYNLRGSYSDSYVIANRARIYGQPDFTSTGVAVTYHSPDDSWYLKAFARNLEDEVQLSVVSTSYSIGTSPRTWGVGAGIKF